MFIDEPICDANTCEARRTLVLYDRLPPCASFLLCTFTLDAFRSAVISLVLMILCRQMKKRKE